MFDFLRWRRPSDGSVPALETVATGTSPAELSAAAVSVPAGRRERIADPGPNVIVDRISQKVLHGWLTNRNQTLVPLSLNCRQFSDDQRAVLPAVLAAIVTTGQSADALAAATQAVHSWLKSIGAEPAMADAFTAALAAPGPFGPLIDRSRALGLELYAYVGALVASGPDAPATELVCDLLGARFELSSAVMRSAARRYRR